MSNSSGSALTRTHGSDRFYSPPAVRKNQKQPQPQPQRPLKSDIRVDSAEPDTRTDSDDSSLLRPNSVASSSPPTTPNSTNFDRLLASLTPHVPARILSEVIAWIFGLFSCSNHRKPWQFFYFFSLLCPEILNNLDWDHITRALFPRLLCW